MMLQIININFMEKKNNLIVIFVVIIVIAVIAYIFMTKNTVNGPTESETATQTEVEFNEAITSDTTTSINETLNNIDLTDTSSADLQAVDQELQNL